MPEKHRFEQNSLKAALMSTSVAVVTNSVGLLALSLILGTGGFGQQLGSCSPTAKQSGTIACLIPQVLGHLGLTPIGNASGASLLISPLTAAVPLPSPASGAIYSYNSALGAYQRNAESFGPLLTERAETIGRNNFAFGFAFQRFVFDKLDGYNLHNLSLSANGLSFNYNVGLSLNQFTIFGSYGITDHIDVSIAVPVNTVKAGVALSLPAFPYLASAQALKTVTGLGDITFQAKDTIYRLERAALAVGVAIRAPTGDAYNALGAGAVGIRSFVAGSYAYKYMSPHVNLGYQWNGRSVLMGNVLAGEKAEIPKQLSYAAGFDSSVEKRLTLSFDVIGRELFNAPRFSRNPLNSVWPQSSFAMTDGSVGFKVNPVRHLLLGGNLLFRMGDAGLRSKVAPLFSISYTL